MPDVEIAPLNSDRHAVSTLLDIAELQRPAQWQPGELTAILRHQLQAPLSLSLGTLSAQVAHAIRETQPLVEPLLTLDQLLHRPDPPVQLLRLVKQFAKGCRDDPANALPAEIVMLLYYAAIATALTRCGERISNLPDKALRRGVRWVARQGWVDDRSREFLLETLARLDSSELAPGTSIPSPPSA